MDACVNDARSLWDSLMWTGCVLAIGVLFTLVLFSSVTSRHLYRKVSNTWQWQEGKLRRRQSCESFLSNLPAICRQRDFIVCCSVSRCAKWCAAAEIRSSFPLMSIMLILCQMQISQLNVGILFLYIYRFSSTRGAVLWLILVLITYDYCNWTVSN